MPRELPTDDWTETIGRRYRRFVDRMQKGELNAAAEEFARLCHWMQKSSLKFSNRMMAAFTEGWLEVFWQCRRWDLVLKVSEDAESYFGDDPEWRFARGEALFYLGRFDEAREILEKLTHEDFDEPMVFYLLACLAERRHNEQEALRLFQTANKLDSKSMLVPVPVNEQEVETLYRECLDELPEKIAWHVKELPIFVDAFPSDELIHSMDPPLDPLVLGVFLGEPMGNEPTPWPSDQPRILLFHKNIAKIAGDFDALEDELRRTLFHEVGHYLGFDEDQLEEMGLA
ncbi:MAG TPA: metallopeptidase family protein [Candidatus Sumerlaeota bacterium]|nr:metallopeptidase family protein [Candidatus Sumerlaeota bacterium]